MERFDPVVRIFGTSDDNKKKNPTKEKWQNVGRKPNEEALDILVKKGKRCVR